MLAVKGSGGDLGTLDRSGTRAGRPRAAARDGARVRGGSTTRTTWSPCSTTCRFGAGGAVPSIDTPLHGFLPAAHVDHLHPDSLIALRGRRRRAERLVQSAFGGRRRVARLAAARASSSACACATSSPRSPTSSVSCSAATASSRWADTSDESRGHVALPDRAGRAVPRGARTPATIRVAVERGTAVCRTRNGSSVPRHSRLSCAVSPPRIDTSSDDFTDSDVVLDFLASDAAPRLAALGTSCPDHFLRTKVRPLLLDLPADSPVEEQAARLRELHRRVPRRLRGATTSAHATPDVARRCAAPIRRSCWCPASACGASAPTRTTARVAGEFFVNAINVMRGAEAVSSYAPISDAEKFRVEYWELEERKLRAAPAAAAARRAGRLRHRRALGHRPRDREAARRPKARASSSPTSTVKRPPRGRRARSAPIGRSPSRSTSADEQSVTAALDATALRFGGVDIVVNNAGSRELRAARRHDGRRLGPPARRAGTRLVPREPRGGPHADRSGTRRRHRVRRVEERGLRRAEQRRLRRGQGRPGAPGPAARRRARPARHPRQRREPRRCRARGRGSSPATGPRSGPTAYGVDPERARRVLRRAHAARRARCCREHVADAVVALVGGDLSRTTGTAHAGRRRHRRPRSCVDARRVIR